MPPFVLDNDVIVVHPVDQHVDQTTATTNVTLPGLRHKIMEHASRCSSIDEEVLADPWSEVRIQFRNNMEQRYC